MIGVNKDGNELIIRIDLSRANPLVEQLWLGFQRAARLPTPHRVQIVRTAYACLLQAIAQTIAECGPDMWAEVRKLNAEALNEQRA